MSIPYTFHPRLVLRTPAHPLHTELDETLIRELMQQTAFLEAIYLASPVLYDECIKWKNGQLKNPKEEQKIMQSLVKYYTRMCTRCTPFGLFSGCNVVPWQQGSDQLILATGKSSRHTRFDMYYLCALAARLAAMPAIQPWLTYYPNNSLYQLGDEWRYVEYQYHGGRRFYQITSVSATDYLQEVLTLTAHGLTLRELTAQLCITDASPEEIAGFVDELVAAQVLVPELDPAVTGQEFLHQIILVLEKVWQQSSDESTASILRQLKIAAQLLQNIDQAAANEAAAYRQIQALLKELEIPFDENRLFQSDLIKEAEQGGIDPGLQQELLKGLQALNALTAYHGNENTRSFINRFRERYEEREMPLLEVLDTETGIGYGNKNSGDLAPLIEDILVPGQKEAAQHLRWGPIEKLLQTKLTAATNAYSIDITEQELQSLDSNGWNDLPPTMSVVFRLTNTEDAPIYLEHTGGSSAANLLGRFAHADPGIHALVQEITQAEQAKDPGVIFAEVVHLPETRVGNILLRPAFRQYEIPYLSPSSVDPDHQLRVKDLLISVRNDRIVLRAKGSNKLIIPRLSSAQNYGKQALPVYQFLCELQLQQQRQGLSFTWGGLSAQYAFLPRVQYQRVILFPASWHLAKESYNHLSKYQGRPLMEQVQQFRQQWQLPRYIVLSDGDNELWVDLDNELSVNCWLEIIRKRPYIDLKEFLGPHPTAVSSETGQPYCNQFLATLIKDQASYAHPSLSRPEGCTIQRNFSIGSEWCYYKLYCGARSADRILDQVLRPVVQQLEQQQLIDQYFFIRYADPSLHLRIRFHLPNPAQTGEITRLMDQYLLPWVQEGLIWKVQTDTYQRELERYGASAICLAESFFHYDSAATLDLLHHTADEDREEIRWLWALRSIDQLLNLFLQADEKMVLLEKLKNAFAKEFGGEKFLKDQLSDKYRKHKLIIENLLNRQLEEDPTWQPLLAAITQRDTLLQPVADQLMAAQARHRPEVPLEDLLCSYVHMLVNRIMVSKARLHELVLYDFLFRYYRSAAARQKKTIPSSQNIIAA